MADAAPAPVSEAASEAPSPVSATTPPPSTPAEAPEQPAAPEATQAGTSSAPDWWPWTGAILALLAAAGAGLWFWRRRERTLALPPPVERPVAPPSAAPPPAAPEASPPARLRKPAGPARPPEPIPSPAFGLAEDIPAENESPLSFAIEARQLSISLTAATLSYRITLTNSGRSSLTGVAIAGDMISAHASRPQDEQLATQESPLQPCHHIERIPGGQSTQVTGEFRLPLPMIQPIRRGDLALFVPLARLRVIADGGGAQVKTALIGQRSTRPGTGLLPFRLDLGPRIYREVTQKIFS